MTKILMNLLALFLFVGCQSMTKKHNGKLKTNDLALGDVFAVSNLEPRSESIATGKAWFTRSKDGFQIVVSVSGVAPGPHGIHIHENGDCSSPDAQSAGEHYNPAGLLHGSPDPMRSHAGDMGNIMIDQDGHGVLNLIIPPSHYHPKFADWSKIIGKSIVLHARADDLVSQPSGDSGDRIACGVITLP